MRLILVLALTGWLWASLAFAGESTPSTCSMQPGLQSIHMQDGEFNWMRDGDVREPCDNLPSDGWSRRSTGLVDLHVHADGPTGSGRFWTVTVGVSGKNESQPTRGVCFATSTLGWRTLQRFSMAPLPWLDDVNNDGRAEFILWDSFPLHKEGSMAEYGLMAWVYRLVVPDSLVLDLNLSRDLARLLAKEYRSPAENDKGNLGDLREKAAVSLEKFAEQRCSLLTGNRGRRTLFPGGGGNGVGPR